MLHLHVPGFNLEERSDVRERFGVFLEGCTNGQGHLDYFTAERNMIIHNTHIHLYSGISNSQVVQAVTLFRIVIAIEVLQQQYSFPNVRRIFAPH